MLIASGRFEDYVGGSLKRVVDFILPKRPAGKGSPPCLAIAWEERCRRRSPRSSRTRSIADRPLPLQIDFSGQESLLNLWNRPKVLSTSYAFSRLPMGIAQAIFLQWCFLLMKPVQNLLEKPLYLPRSTGKPRFVSNYFAMEYWRQRQHSRRRRSIPRIRQKSLSVHTAGPGEFRLGAHRVRSRPDRCPLLLLTAENDHLVAPPLDGGMLHHVASRDVDTMRIDAGHVGWVGGRAQGFLAPGRPAGSRPVHAARALRGAESRLSN